MEINNITREELLQAISISIDKITLCKNLGIKDTKEYYSIIDYLLSKYNLKLRKAPKILLGVTDEEFIKVWNISKSRSNVIKHFNGNPNSGSLHKSIIKYSQELGLNESHMKNQAWNKGKKFQDRYRVSLEEAMVENSTYTNGLLKKRLLKNNMLTYTCAWCGNSGEWNNETVTLEMDHINGRSNDNRLENLRILCPVCHGYTPTFRGRNKVFQNNMSKENFKLDTSAPFDIDIKNSFENKNDKCLNCDNKTINNNNLCLECISIIIKEESYNPIYKNNKIRQYTISNTPSISHCNNCSKNIKSNKTGLCSECYQNSKSNSIPNVEELLKIIKQNNVNLTETGKYYNVTSNSIVKWLKKYGIPYHVKDLRNHINENIKGTNNEH